MLRGLPLNIILMLLITTLKIPGVTFFNRTNTIAKVKTFRRIIQNYPIPDEEVRDIFTNYYASNTAE